MKKEKEGKPGSLIFTLLRGGERRGGLKGGAGPGKGKGEKRGKKKKGSPTWWYQRKKEKRKKRGVFSRVFRRREGELDKKEFLEKERGKKGYFLFFLGEEKKGVGVSCGVLSVGRGSRLKKCQERAGGTTYC